MEDAEGNVVPQKLDLSKKPPQTVPTPTPDPAAGTTVATAPEKTTYIKEVEKLIKGTQTAPPEKKEEVEKPAAGETTAKPEHKEDAVYTSKKAKEWNDLKTNFQSRIKEIETKASNLTKDLELARAENESLKKQQFDPKEFETIKSEREKLKSQLETVALERSEPFQKYFDAKFSSATAKAKSSVPTEIQEHVENLLQLRPSKTRKDQLNAVMEQLDNEADKLQLIVAFGAMDEARAERDEALKNSAENLKKAAVAAAAKKAELEQQAKTLRERDIEVALGATKGYRAFSEIEGDAEHNNAIANRTAWVRKALSGELDEAAYKTMPIKATEADYLREKVVPGLEAKVKELEAAIIQLNGSDPNAQPHGEPERPKAKTYVEAVLEKWPGASKRR